MGSLLQIYFPGHHQAGIDTGMHPKRFSNPGFKFGTDGFNHIVYFTRGLYGAYGIILMGLGHPKKRHDGIADKFFNKPVIFVYDL